MAAPAPVLLMARELGLGGSERQLTEIAKSLDRSRFEPHVGCFRRQGIRVKELECAEVPVVDFRVRSLRGPSTPAAAVRMGRYLARHQIQLVHTFDVPTNLFGVPAARVFRTPVVLSSQRAYRSLTPGLSRHLLRLTDQIVDGVVVNCETMRRHLIEDEGVPPAWVHVCYNCVDAARFKPLPGSGRPAALREASLVIGVVSALRPEKGLGLLLEAFRLVRVTHPGLKLLIVGDGPCSSELEKQSRELGIRSDCLFEGATNQVADWLRAIDIFVSSSLSEAFSNSLMEAMACGCAVAASRAGGNPELVEDGRTGVLFETGNAGAMAAVLSELIERPALRAELGAAAANTVHQRFSIDAAAKRMGEIYSSLLEGRILTGSRTNPATARHCS